MEIIKWDENCTSCYFATEQDGECINHDTGPCKGGLSPTKYGGDYWHYANADQIKGLIEEAEKGYEWSKENVLWVCSGYETCDIDCCQERTPHKYNSGRCTYGVCHFGHNNGCEVSCIPYRVEPKEDDMNDVPSNARGLEYRLIKEMSLKILSEDIFISDSDFRDIYMSQSDMTWPMGTIFSVNGFGYEIVHEHSKKLLKAGYIEEVVPDPVVKLGDAFKYVVDDADDDTWAIVVVSAAYFDTLNRGNTWCLRIIKSNVYVVGATIGVSVNKKENTTMRMSDLLDLNLDSLKEFTPCKIEIREVEE